MKPGAIQQFHDRQSALLEQTYDQAWAHGVASYAPDEDPEEEDEGGSAALAVGAGAGLLAARGSRYQPPAGSQEGARNTALSGAQTGLASMVAELGALQPSADHVQSAVDAAQAGTITGGEVAGYAEGLAAQDWLDSNEWRLNAGDSVAWAGEQDGYAQAANADGQLLEWLPEADDRVCEDCEALGDLPPMPLSDWPTTPGAGETICNAGCRCVLQVADDQTIGPEGELPELSQQQEDFVSELSERREPLEGPQRISAAMAGDTKLGRLAEAAYVPDVSQAIGERDALYRQAERVKPEYDALITRAGEAIGAEGGRGFEASLQTGKPAIITAPLKAKDARATEKVEGKYEGDWTRLKGIVRGTISVPHASELEPALRAVVAEVRATPGWSLDGIENRYSLDAGSRVNTGANGFGYRDVSMHLVSPDGHVSELQLNTSPMIHAKEFEGGHKLYEDVRGITERPQGSSRTAEEKALVARNRQASRELYSRAEREARHVARGESEARRTLLDTSAVQGEAHTAAREVEEAIAKVIPEFDHVLPVVALPAEDAATARLVQRDGHPAIGIHPDSPAKTLVPAMTHEIGHYIDRYVLGDGSDFGNYGDHLYKLMRDSPTMVELRKGEIAGLGKFEDDPLTRQLYMGREQYARAFAQTVAERSENPLLRDWLARTQADPTLRAEVWQREEFAKIRSELESQLRREGAPAAEHEALLGDLSKLTPEHQQDVRDQVAKLPDDVAKLLADHGVKIESADRVYAGAHYDPSKRTVMIDNYGFVLNKGQAPVLLHELGHAFDHAVGNVSKDPGFRALHKDAKPRKGSYYSRGFGSGPYKTDPRQELFAEAAAHIWNGTESPDFTLTPYLRELITELPSARAGEASIADIAKGAAREEHTAAGATGEPAGRSEAAKLAAKVDLGTATPAEIIEVGRAVRAEADRKLGARWDKRLAKLKERWLATDKPAQEAMMESLNAEQRMRDAIKAHGENSPEHLAALKELQAAEKVEHAAAEANDKARETFLSMKGSIERFKRPEALQEALADIRSMGGEVAKAPGMAPLASGALDQAASHLPTAWLERSNVAGEVKAVIRPDTSGGRANHVIGHWTNTSTGVRYVTDSTINGGAKEWANPSTVLHELSHRMEYVIPHLQEQLDAFWRQRTGHELVVEGGDLKKLSEITGNDAYDAFELADPDQFTNAYMGKVYERAELEFDADGHVHLPERDGAVIPKASAGEIFTTGQEGIWHGHYDLLDTRFLGASERAAADEYAAFILGLLATL